MSSSSDNPTQRPSRLLDIEGVRQRLGGDPLPDHSTVCRLIQQGRLPRPVKIGARMARWLEHEVDEAIRRRALDRDRAA